MAKPRTAKQDAISQRRQQIGKLLLGGMSQRQIADALGVGVGTVNRDITALRKEWRESTNEVVRLAMEVDLQRIDRLFRALWSRSIDGDLRAVDRVLKLMEQRKTLLRYEDLPRYSQQVDSQQILLVEVIKNYGDAKENSRNTSEAWN